MASYSLSLSFGQTEFSITEGTAVPGAGDVELRVNLANIPTVSGGSGAGNARVQEILIMFENWLMGKGNKIG